jgi:hypothetical protein
MEGQSGSNDHLPEVHNTNFSAQHPYQDFEYYEQPPPAQVPQYQQYAESPALSQSGEAGRATGEHRRTPPVADRIHTGTVGSPKDRPLSPSSTAQYSEVNSPGLQSVYEKEGEKEVLKNQTYAVHVAGSG